MTFTHDQLMEAIDARHSVRRYQAKPLPADIADELREKAREVNAKGRLHVQLVLNEPKAYKGALAYGKFEGVESYLVMAGQADDSLDERIGYYGEQLVLMAQMLGLNTCWTGLTHRKIPGTYVLGPGEKIGCYIALGYGQTQGKPHKGKTAAQVSRPQAGAPQWFAAGVEAALKAPTAINQQKFMFEYLGGGDDGSAPRVLAKRLFSLVGYTKMDLGIAKLHFEIGANRPIEWVEE